MQGILHHLRLQITEISGIEAPADDAASVEGLGFRSPQVTGHLKHPSPSGLGVHLSKKRAPNRWPSVGARIITNSLAS